MFYKILISSFAICFLSLNYGQDSTTIRTADLGIRFSTEEYNRVQVEFRKPFGNFYRWRLGASYGFNYYNPVPMVLNASDSLVTMRKKEVYGTHYDLRFGFERTVAYPWLSFHADLIFAYSIVTNSNWNYYYKPDSTSTWAAYSLNPYTQLTEEKSTATNGVIGGGAVLGISFNLPVTKNFILNFTGNYAGIMRTSVSQKETNDIYNEFEPSSASIFEIFPSAGLGLRFVFDPKEAAEPAPETGGN